MVMARVSFGSRADDQSDYLRRIPGPTQITSLGSYASFDDLSNALRRELDDAAQRSSPGCLTLECSLQDSVSLALVRPRIGPYAEGGEHDLPPEFKTFPPDDPEASYPTAPVHAIVAVQDQEARSTIQRAGSRGILAGIQAADGYKYTFNNAWNSKDEEGSRFSYVCQDSMQNKDRHANGYTKTQKHLKGIGERGPQKPTYDCKGSISVKFSSSRQTVEIYYRHHMVHGTVAERKPTGRPSRKSRAKGSSKIRWKHYPNDGVEAPDSIPPGTLGQSPPTSRPQKRKREISVALKSSSQPPSLFELLSQSPGAKVPPPKIANAATRPAATTLYKPPPVAYDLPAWQAPASLLPPPPPSMLALAHNVTVPFPHNPYQQHHQLLPPGAFRHTFQQPGHASGHFQQPGHASAHIQAIGLAAMEPGNSPNGVPDPHHGQAKSQSKAQGLFQTLKQTNKTSTMSPELRKLNNSRGNIPRSCTTCRRAKRKVSLPVPHENAFLTDHYRFSAMSSDPSAVHANWTAKTTTARTTRRRRSQHHRTKCRTRKRQNQMVL